MNSGWPALSVLVHWSWNYYQLSEQVSMLVVILELSFLFQVENYWKEQQHSDPLLGTLKTVLPIDVDKLPNTLEASCLN